MTDPHAAKVQELAELVEELGGLHEASVEAAIHHGSRIHIGQGGTIRVIGAGNNSLYPLNSEAPLRALAEEILSSMPADRKRADVRALGIVERRIAQMQAARARETNALRKLDRSGGPYSGTL